MGKHTDAQVWHGCTALLLLRLRGLEPDSIEEAEGPARYWLMRPAVWVHARKKRARREVEKEPRRTRRRRRT